MKRMVKVKSMSSGEVYIVNPMLGINRIWPRKGAEMGVDFELLQEALYHQGVRALFEGGDLYIEDMKDKIDLGLEPEGAEEPKNLIVLSDKDIQNLLTKYSIVEFKNKLKTVSAAQVEEVCGYAIEKKIMPSFEKNTYLRERVGIDILLTIQADNEVAEAEKRKS